MMVTQFSRGGEGVEFFREVEIFPRGFYIVSGEVELGFSHE